MATGLCAANSDHGSGMHPLRGLFSKAAVRAVLYIGGAAGCRGGVDCHRGLSAAPQFLGIYLADERRAR